MNGFYSLAKQMRTGGANLDPILSEGLIMDPSDLVHLCESIDREFIEGDTEIANTEFSTMLNENFNPADLEALNESKASGLVEKLKKFFQRIVDGIKSVINKIKQVFDGMTKQADAYLEKYDDALNGKDFSKFKRTVYDYDLKRLESITFPRPVDFIKNTENILEPSAILDAYKAALKGFTTDSKEFHDAVKKIVEKHYDKLEELVADKREELGFDYAKACLSGFSSSKSKWKEDLIKYFRNTNGTAKEISFDAGKIRGKVKNVKEFTRSMPEAYDDLKEAVEDNETKFLKIAEDIEDAMKDLSSEQVGEKKACSLAVEYINKYISLYNKVLEYAAFINAKRIAIAEEMCREHFKILRAMVAYKPASESIDVDEDLLDSMDAEDFVSVVMEA